MKHNAETIDKNLWKRKLVTFLTKVTLKDFQQFHQMSDTSEQEPVIKWVTLANKNLSTVCKKKVL